MARIRLGDLLVKAGLIDEMQLQSALAHQRQWGGKLGDILVNNGFLDEMMLWRGLSKQLGVQLVSLPELKLTPGIEKQVPLDLCQKNAIFPVHRDDKALTVATSDPNNIGGLDDLAFRLGVRLRTVLAPDREVEWAIRRYHQGDPAPCPAPRTRRFTEDAASTPSAPPPTMEIQHQSNLELAAMANRAAQAAAGTLPPMSAPPPQGPFTPQPTGTWQPQPTGTFQPQSTGFFQAQPTQPWTAPTTPQTEAELMIRDTAHLLRFLVESCIQRGLFTREDFLNKLKQM